MKRKILFVCLGNICRSPAAEGVLKAAAGRKGLSDKIAVDSAGTYGGHAGQLPDSRMRSAAARRGSDLTHRARQITEENYESVSRLAPERRYLDKLYRFAEFCGRHPQWSHVPDPYYEGREGFELVLDLLEDGCEGILEKMADE